MSGSEFETPHHHRIVTTRNARGELEARVVNKDTGVIRPLGEQLSRDVADWQKALSWRQHGELIAQQLWSQVPGGPDLMHRLGPSHAAMLPYAEQIAGNEQIVEHAKQMAERLEIRIGQAADRVAEGHGVTFDKDRGQRQL